MDEPVEDAPVGPWHGDSLGQGPGPLLDPERRRWIVEQVERHGRSRKSLAAELSAAGVPTATGRGRWYPSTIAGVLASVA